MSNLNRAKSAAAVVLPVFITAHFAHHLVTGSLTPLLPRLRSDFNLDYSTAGALLGAFTFTYGITQIPIAALGDRFSRRKLLAVSMFGVGATAIAMGFCSSYWQLLALLAVMGLFGAGYHPLASAFLSLTFDKAHRGRSLGTHTIGGSGSLLITPLLAVGLAGFFDNWRAAYVILGAVPIVLGFVILSAARKEEAEHGRLVAATGGEKVSPLAVARAIGLLMMVAMVASMLGQSVSGLLPLYLVDKHKVGPEVAGIVVGLVAGGGILGAPLGGALSDRFGRAPVITASLLLAGPLLWLLTILPFGAGLLATMALYGLILSARMPVMESAIADVVPPAQRGTALGVYFFLTQETAAISTPVVGAFIDRLGADPVLVYLAIIGIGTGVLALFIRGGKPAAKIAAGPV
ncbi:MAG: MFS transporter [Chloroflexota bacterium]